MNWWELGRWETIYFFTVKGEIGEDFGENPLDN